MHLACIPYMLHAPLVSSHFLYLLINVW